MDLTDEQWAIMEPLIRRRSASRTDLGVYGEMRGMS